MHADADAIERIEGIGPVIARSMRKFFSDAQNACLVEKLLKEITLLKEKRTENASVFENKTFVITGSVHHFANRNAVKVVIEERGGKVTGSISSKTDYLINNDIESSSSKNKKAKELGIPIITEDDFLKMLEM